MGSTLYQVFSDVLWHDSIPSATRPQRRSESWLHRSPLSSRGLRILDSLAHICPKLRVMASLSKLGVSSMGQPIMGVSTMDIPIIETPTLRALIMGVLIEDVSITGICTMGSHTHYEYTY